MTKILLDEDSNFMQAANFIKKESADVEVVTVRNGEEAISKYQTEYPNFVFMDIKMACMEVRR